MQKCANAKMQKLKLLWTQVLPKAKAALRTPMMKEPCQRPAGFFDSVHAELAASSGIQQDKQHL